MEGVGSAQPVLSSVVVVPTSCGLKISVATFSATTAARPRSRTADGSISVRLPMSDSTVLGLGVVDAVEALSVLQNSSVLVCSLIVRPRVGISMNALAEAWTGAPVNSNPRVISECRFAVRSSSVRATWA